MTKEKKPTPIESALTEYNTENLTMSAIKIFKDAEALECVDVESRKVIGKHRAQIKTFRIQVEDKRKEINRDSQKDNNNKATMLVDILNLSFDVFDKKIKAYDSVADEKRLAKAKIERDRLGRIQWRMDGLIEDCASLEYGMNSQQIAGEIRFLEMIEVSAVDFDIRFEEANEKLEEAKHFVLDAHERALDWEAKQKAEAELAAKNKADADKLAKEQAAFKKEQEDAKAEQKKKDDAAALIASQGAEKTRKANADLKARQDILDKAESDLKAAKSRRKEIQDCFNDTLTNVRELIAGENIESLTRYSRFLESDKLFSNTEFFGDRFNEMKSANLGQLSIIAQYCYTLANYENTIFDASWDRAKEIDKAIEKEKSKTDKARSKLIADDKKALIEIVLLAETHLTALEKESGGCRTGEAVDIEAAMIQKIKEAVQEAEQAITGLA